MVQTEKETEARRVERLERRSEEEVQTFPNFPREMGHARDLAGYWVRTQIPDQMRHVAAARREEKRRELDFPWGKAEGRRRKRRRWLAGFF
jgi:hypothetical protein